MYMNLSEDNVLFGQPHTIIYTGSTEKGEEDNHYGFSHIIHSIYLKILFN